MIMAPELSTAAQNCAEAHEIEPQVANIVNALKQEQQEAGNAASNPLRALVSGLMTSLESSGSWQQVSNYAQAHCRSGGTS
jgi:hypothetical protein